MKLIHLKEPEHNQKIISRQSKEILKIKPDIILFEFPQESGFSLRYFNKFPPNEKPKQKIEKLKQGYKSASKIYPWLRSEHKIIESIERLWHKEKQVYLFEIDAPVELTSSGEGTKNLLNIVWNYLREVYMVKNIRKIAKNTGKKKVLLLCHDFHWKNICFLLKNPSKNKVQEYYFIKNGINNSPKEIQEELKEKNKFLYKYWKLLKQDF